MDSWKSTKVKFVVKESFIGLFSCCFIPVLVCTRWLICQMRLFCSVLLRPCCVNVPLSDDLKANRAVYPSACKNIAKYTDSNKQAASTPIGNSTKNSTKRFRNRKHVTGSTLKYVFPCFMVLWHSSFFLWCLGQLTSTIFLCVRFVVSLVGLLHQVLL